jgi:hypothetical protein
MPVLKPPRRRQLREAAKEVFSPRRDSKHTTKQTAVGCRKRNTKIK